MMRATDADAKMPTPMLTAAGPRRVIFSLAVIALACAALLALAAPARAEAYTVQPGDTFSGIAARFGISRAVLQALNPEIGPPSYQVNVGQRIRLPDNVERSSDGESQGDSSAADEGASVGTYTVRSGETLWGISVRLGVELSALMALNPALAPDYGVFADQEIQVPNEVSSGGSQGTAAGNSEAASAASTPSAAPRTWLVEPGDTLIKIASRFGLSLDTLVELNPQIDPDLLYVGAEITLSSGAAEPGRRAVTAGAAAPQALPRTTDGVQYVVQAGDYATGIAETYGVTLADLQEANGDSLAVVRVGQVLRIPLPDALIPAEAGEEDEGERTYEYIVASGDFALTIAEMHGISFEELQRLNPNEDLSTIYPGQGLTVPWIGELVRPAGTAPAILARHRMHTVVAGDNLSGIAERYGMTLEELRGHNPGRGSDLVSPGDRIRIGGVEPMPVVAGDVTVEHGDLVQYVAAELGVLPQTLIANNDLAADQWIPAGAVLRVPYRDGTLVTVQPGDTLLGIAQYHGVEMAAILADPGHGVEDANEIVIGQQIILPIAAPEFHWPVVGTLTDGFGLCRNWDCSYRHRGLDVAVDMWAPITAAADGLVTFVGGDPCCGLGLYVEVEHPGGWSTIYAHLTEFEVWQGQLVRRGETVGYNGSTGLSTGPHLHFEVHHHDWYVDPLVVLP